MPIAIITGSAGLVGSQAESYFHEKGFEIAGIDNNLRKTFFGEVATTYPLSSAILWIICDGGKSVRP